MKKQVYISSTFEDLRSHREAAYMNLRGLPVTVKAMEDYLATDERPLAKCLKDVRSSQIYVGLFAWRYGYIPRRNNPKKKSITELEYRQAQESGAERLVFLTRSDHPWSPAFIDAVVGKDREAKQIMNLREELREELICDFFTTADNLAAKVTGAVAMALSREPVVAFTLPREITDVSVIRKFGSTLTPEIIEKIKGAMDDAAGSRVIEIHLGSGRTWWSTRLFLLAALAESFTDIQSLMFVGGKGSFIGMATPKAVRNAMARQDARLEEAYRRSLPSPDLYVDQPGEAVVHTAQNFRNYLEQAEEALKVWMTKKYLTEVLGDELSTIRIDLDANRPPDTATLLTEVLNKDTDMVAVFQRGGPPRVMDRLGLAKNIATSALKMRG